MELNEQTNSWIDEQSYKDEFERVEQFKKRNEFINMKILWLSGNPALYKRKSMIDGGWIGTLQKEIVKENTKLINLLVVLAAIGFAYDSRFPDHAHVSLFDPDNFRTVVDDRLHPM